MIEFKKSDLPVVVSQDVMNEVYSKLKTPYKYGGVCVRKDELTDSPTVFKLGEKWYMMYLTISKECATSGYSTWISESEDLIEWTPIGPVLERNDEGNWDSKQIAGYLGLPDVEWNGSGVPKTIGGKYYVTYLGGNSDGYEPTPLYMGLAQTEDVLNSSAYVRNPSPLLSPTDSDCRESEKLAIYRSLIFKDPHNVTGYPYMLVYNAKAEDYKERIFLAVSEDGENWIRYGDRPVFDGTLYNEKNKISADAQIICMGNLYVMVYFSMNYDEKAYSTFACSYDLVNWTKWQGTPLIESEYDWENCHAHKSWVICHNGVTYNYYCAVNSNNERFIALATSKKIK